MFYKVVVKIKQEAGFDKNDQPKYKNVQEQYIVSDCGSPQNAANRVEKEMSGCIDEWQIDSVKELKLTGILSDN